MTKASGKIIYFLFVLMYVPFFYKYGVSYISTKYIDFPSFYSAARVVFEQNQSPYNYKELHDAGKFHGPPYLYPPPSLLIFYPLSLLSYNTAKTVMLGISHASFLVFLYILFFKIMRLEAKEAYVPFAVVYIFLYHPITNTLWLGQINLPVLVFLCLTWYTVLRNSKPLMIAFPLSLAILMKTYPAVIIFYFIAKKQWSVIQWLLILVTGYCLMAYVFLPGDVWPDWCKTILPSGGYGEAAASILRPTSPYNQGINGFISRLLVPTQYSEVLLESTAAAGTVTYVISLVLLFVATALCSFSLKNYTSEQTIHLEFSLFLVTMFLIAPFAWEHHLVFILPSVIYVGSLLAYSEDNKPLVVIVGVSALVLAWNIPIGSVSLRKGIATLLISTKLYAVMVIWMYLLLKIWQSARHTIQLPIFWRKSVS